MGWTKVLGITGSGSLLIPAATAHPITLEDIFGRYRDLDLSHIYDSYTGLIDLFIYTLIFTGVAQATLGRRFPGRPGQAMSIGMGVTLAVALAAAEQALGFNMKSFGPFAAGTLIILLGVMIHRLLRFADVSHAASAGIAYIAVFLTTLSITPELFDWLSENAPILAVASLIALLFALLGAFSPLWPGRHTPAVGGAERNINSELIRRGRRGSRRAVADSAALLSELRAMRRTLQQRGSDPRIQRDTAVQIRILQQRQHDMMSRLEGLRGLNKRILGQDASFLSKARGSRPITAQGEACLREEVRGKTERLGIEDKIEKIESAAEEHVGVVTRHLGEASEALTRDQPERAVEALDKAIASEHAAEKIAREATRLEDALEALADKAKA